MSTAQLHHKNNMDFLRLFFASLVILSHSPELVDGNRHRELLTQIFHTMSLGEVAVAGFFTLSGYLIVQSWERSPNLFSFFKKRVLRIYPGFIVAALFTAFVFGPLGSENARYFSEFNYVSFVKSVLLLSIPATPPTMIGNGAMWTIQSEFICYMIVALMGFSGLSKCRYLAPFLYVLIAAHLIRKNALFAPFTFFGYFLSGTTFYYFREHIRYTRRGSLIAVCVLFVAMFHPMTSWLGITTVGTYFLFACSFAHAPFLQNVARSADISYGTYLYGWPIQMSLIHFVPSISPWGVFAIALPLSMICGWLSFKIVEQPFLRLKRSSPTKVVANECIK